MFIYFFCSKNNFLIEFNFLFPFFQCWDQCASPSTTTAKINTSTFNDWPIQTILMIKKGSLVSAYVTWPKINDSSHCLVTWEVSGGGLMGTLLTDTSGVQLSLCPDTKYKIEVTCKNLVSLSTFSNL